MESEDQLSTGCMRPAIGWAALMLILVGCNPSAPGTGDGDGDGSDLPSESLCLPNGETCFTRRALEVDAEHIAAGFFDDDNQPDLALVGDDVVYLSLSTQNFAIVQEFPFQSEEPLRPHPVAGDFDGDGDDDLLLTFPPILAGTPDPLPIVFFENTAGSLAQPTPGDLSVNLFAASAVEVDGAPPSELLVAQFGAEPGEILVLEGSKGQWSTRETAEGPQCWTIGTQVGNPDDAWLAAAMGNCPTAGSADYIRLFTADGGALKTSQSLSLSGLPISMSGVDLNDDQAADLLVALSGEEKLQSYFWAGASYEPAGLVSLAQTPGCDCDEVTWLEGASFSGDRDDVFAGALGTGGASLYAIANVGLEPNAVELNIGPTGARVARDFNGDGLTDLAVFSINDAQIILFLTTDA